MLNFVIDNMYIENIQYIIRFFFLWFSVFTGSLGQYSPQTWETAVVKVTVKPDTRR